MRSGALKVAKLLLFFLAGSFARAATSPTPVSTPKIQPPQILWAVPDWPPFFITDKKQPEGVGNQMLKLLKGRLSEYHHEDLDINIPKLLDLWKQGRKICGSDILFNKDRLQHAYLTPLWIYPPLHVIVKEENLEAFSGGKKSIDVFKLIKNSHYKGVLLRARSYGPPVDEIIDELTSKELTSKNLTSKEFVTLISPVGNWQDYLHMIASGRADYTIDYAKVAKTYNQTHPDRKRLAALSITGYEKPFIVNIACTKNPWGKIAIKEMDHQIQLLAKDPAYRELLEKVFANEQISAQQKDIDQFILKRSKGPWFWGPID